jgi:hypothetical protein
LYFIADLLLGFYPDRHYPAEGFGFAAARQAIPWQTCGLFGDVHADRPRRA